MPTALSSWFHRTVIAGLLLLAYLYAWTPVRTAWTAQSVALLKHVIEAKAPPGSINGRPTGHVLGIETTGNSTFGYTAPAGVKFLLPAGFLVLVAPSRPKLGTFFLGHLGLGALGLGLYAGGVAGWSGGLWMGDFVQAYAVDAYSLAVPALVFARRRSPLSS